jgi:hypothetical protein
LSTEVSSHDPWCKHTQPNTLPSLKNQLQNFQTTSLVALGRGEPGARIRIPAICVADDPFFVNNDSTDFLSPAFCSAIERSAVSSVLGNEVAWRWNVSIKTVLVALCFKLSITAVQRDLHVNRSNHFQSRGESGLG